MINDKIGRWFECAECHDEMVQDHTFKFAVEVAFTCMF